MILLSVATRGDINIMVFPLLTRWSDLVNNSVVCVHQEENGQQRHPKHTQLDEYDSPRPAWSPASRTIPFGR